MITLTDFLNSIRKFFMHEDYVVNLAVFRILFLLLLLVYTLLEVGNVDDFYGPNAITSLETVRERYHHIHLNIFHLLQNNIVSTYFIYFLTVVSMFMSLIGFKTNFFLVISFMCISSLQMRNIWILSSADVLMRSILFILMFSPCSRILSIDSILSQGRDRKILPLKASQWTWRLIQLQVSVVYLWTCWHKLKGETWFEGSAVYYATRLDTMKNFTLPFILDNMFILTLLTWGTLAIEFSLGFLVWFKETRKWVLLAGVFLHLGIEFVMAIPFFEWLMLLLLLSFFTPREYCLLVIKYRDCLKIFMTRIQNFKDFWRPYEA